MKKVYDASKIDFNNLTYTNKALWLLVVPIVVEQLLNSFMGMADSMMVARVGSEAISAVSLVDSINTLIIQIFAAMATGAAIICSQYVGHGNEKGCLKAARQIVLTVFTISFSIMVICLLFQKPLLRLVFGQVEDSVMDACNTYFFLSVLSYPFIALFSAGSAFFRSCGNSRFPMMVSITSNVLNVIGNFIFIFMCDMGVFGAAFATLISRFFCFAVVFIALRKPRQLIYVRDYIRIRPDFPLIWKILAIGIPAGIENGMFQFGKLAIQSTVSTLGTKAIAAQAMASILENVNGIGACGVGVGIMTIAGQCFGAGKNDEAKYYIVKLMKASYVVIFLSCLGVYLAFNPIMYLAGYDAETTEICRQMVTFYTIVKPLVWVPSFSICYGLRAAGDVKFPMAISTLTMWVCRVMISTCLMRYTAVGPMGVWIGMACDWTVRAVIFTRRFFSDKWLIHSKLV